MVFFRGLIVLLATVGTVGAAHAATLSGTTYCGSSPMVGATIAAVSLGTGLLTDDDTTDGAGHYSLTLDNGAYAVTVSPPAGSDCAQQTIDNKPVNGDEVYDIVLVRPGDEDPPDEVTRYTVQGTYTGGSGVAIQNVRVCLYGDIDGTCVNTDVNGHWQMQLQAGSYWREIWYNGATSDPSLPAYFECYGGSYNVTGPSTFDVSLPTVLVRGTLTGNPSGNPKPGVQIYTSSRNGCYTTDAGATTSGDGSFQTLAFASGTGTVSSSAVFGALQSSSQAITTPATGELVVDLVAEEVTTTRVTGRLRGYADMPLSLRINIEDSQGQGFSVTPDAQGEFAFDVVPGSLYLYLSNYNGSGLNTPRYLDCYGNTVVADGTFLDLALPVALVQGSVVGELSGNPVPNVSVSGQAGRNWSHGNCYEASFDTSTDAQGNFGPVAVLAGSGNAYASGINGQFGTSTSAVSVAAGQSASLELLAPELVQLTLSGRLSGRANEPIGNTSLTFDGPQSFSTTTQANGNYSLPVVNGSYRYYLSRNNGTGTAAPPRFYCDFNEQRTFTASDTWNINLPFKRVQGRITNASGIPIQGVNLYVESYGSFAGGFCEMWFQVTTGSDGRYDFAVKTGNVFFEFTPPGGSGYVGTTLNSNIQNDINQEVVLQLPDIVPPVITTGPLVIHHSDTSVSIQWATNEVTDAKLEYQSGAALTNPVVLTRSSLATNHLFTLTGLAAETDHTFRVSGKDGGNNVVASADNSFVTTRDPDTTPPLITDGPTAVYVSPILMRIGWTTNEPADSVVTVSTAGQPDKIVTGSAFVLEHDLVVTGLVPGTLYTVAVTSTDPDDNESLPVDPIEVRTPAVVDQTPPVVTNLRTECRTANVMSICWDTNESSTSAVGYINQGTGAASSVSSSALVLQHCLAVSNLTPATAYTIAVSSTDGGGNTGNGGPITASTLSDSEGGEPIISELFAAAVGATGARVTWQTDRPASTLVQYGTDPQNMTSTAGNVSASETGHTVILSGLPTGQTTYVRVVSTNQCGQTTTSDPVPVTDVDECQTGSAGCDINADCSHTVGNTTCSCKPGFTGNGTHCCAVCTGGRERATDCGAVAESGCDFRPTLGAQTLQAFAGSALNTVIGQVVAGDQDPGDVLTFAITSGNGAGAFAINSSGALRVANPNALVAGTSVVLTVRVLDALGLSASGPVTVAVLEAPGPCAASPCVNGACVENGDVAECDCTGSGYGGNFCQTDVDECASDNGGCEDVCVNDPGGFHCTCASGTLASDGTSCLAAGECVSVETCDELTEDLVFYGVVGDESGEPVGSIKCTRAFAGGVTCDNEGGELVVSPVLWCAP